MRGIVLKERTQRGDEQKDEAEYDHVGDMNDEKL